MVRSRRGGRDRVCLLAYGAGKGARCGQGSGLARCIVPSIQLGHFVALEGRVDAALLALSESVLDEINCVDVFGPESEYPYGDSETYTKGKSLIAKRPWKVMVTASTN